MANKAYPNGYLPKIQYWTDKLNAAINHTKSPDMVEVASILTKLNYFTERQIKHYER